MEENTFHNTARLLVIDSNESSCSLIKRRLAMYGYEVTVAANSKEAFKKIESGTIDVILLNMFLDGINSLHLLQSLKKDRDYMNVPVIVISNDNDTELLVECIEAGAEDYLVKPLNQTILKARLSNCIARKEAYDKELQYIAKIKEGQKQIAAQEKMASVGVLVTSISNELKNPLNFIINFAEVSEEICSELLTNLKENNLFAEESQKEILLKLEKFQSNISKISKYGRNVDQIIRFMLDQSNTDNGQKHPTNINKVITQTINMLMSSYKAKGVTNLPQITEILEENVPHIVLSIQAFSKVIYNLLDNAVYSVLKKFEDQTLAKIKISVENHLNNIDIIIRDNGIGVSEDIRSKIFDPFFTTKEGGLNPGLGLSTSLKIIRDLKGSLSFSSVEGEFTEFKIVIPKK